MGGQRANGAARAGTPCACSLQARRSGLHRVLATCSQNEAPGSSCRPRERRPSAGLRRHAPSMSCCRRCSSFSSFSDRFCACRGIGRLEMGCSAGGCALVRPPPCLHETPRSEPQPLTPLLLPARALTTACAFRMPACSFSHAAFSAARSGNFSTCGSTVAINQEFAGLSARAAPTASRRGMQRWARVGEWGAGVPPCQGGTISCSPPGRPCRAAACPPTHPAPTCVLLSRLTISFSRRATCARLTRASL